MSNSINFIGVLNRDKESFNGDRIRNEIAKRMIQLYMRNYEGGQYKTYGVKFTKDDLLSFEKLLNESKADGFEVFFASYSGDGTTNPPGHNYNWRNTVVFIPTVKGVPVIDPSSEYDVRAGGSDAYNHGELNP